MICDWCYHQTRTYQTAKYVVVTGKMDTMTVEEHFICMGHADELCGRYKPGERRMIAGATFDEWDLHWITEKAHEFYNKRAAGAADQYKRAVRARYLPYTLTEPDTSRLRRERWVHRYPGEIRGSVPIH